jgi:hypothetical protein
MAGARPFILSLVMVTLASLLIIGFVFNFITVTNPTSEIFDAKYDLNDTVATMQTSLSSFEDVTAGVKDTFENSNPTPLDYVFLIFLGAFTIPKALFVFVVSGTNALAGVFYNILWGSIGSVYPSLAPILAVISGLIVAGIYLTGIFLLISVIRSGNSER